ncbi:hypothetical protein BKA65DRAFT_553866 [Rhexocercosporidium sp. MPI-PUGE-AT-0058]|nr:hypothetical protein BKA65DRAFT_553866 [Rhexocercosporidium sp. MPI-PUGE-AT-0058]
MSPLQWSLANPFGIQLDANSNTWVAGNVRDVLSNGEATIVATDSGGVWLINHYPGARFPDTYPAECLSNDWLDTQMSTLAFGPDNKTVIFAAGESAGTIYVLTFQVILGGLKHVGTTKIVFPFYVGGVIKLVVQKNPRVLIAACGLGIFWSVIPSNVDSVTSYSWIAASGLTTGAYSSIALGPGTSVIAAASGGGPVGGTNHYGIFTGQWDTGRTRLSFTAATIIGIDITAMLRTLIASCSSDRRIAYALVGGMIPPKPPNRDGIMAILASLDGGQTWRKMTVPSEDDGHDQWRVNCLDVNPLNSKVVAVGSSNGPWISKDGAATWTQLANHHVDLHCIYFPGREYDANAFFVGSDGGLALMAGNGTIKSEYNIQLANLQMYNLDGDASETVSGLYVAGLQDNGNLYCVADSAVAPRDQSWFQLDAGDGGINRLLPTNQVLRYNNTLIDLNSRIEVGNVVRVARWNGRAFPSGIGDIIPVDNLPLGERGLGYPIMEVVQSPSYRRNRELMWAVGAGQAGPIAQKLWGLFADDNGNGMHWTLIADVGTDIASVTSLDGNLIIYGTRDGYISFCDTASGNLSSMALSTSLTTAARLNKGPIVQLLIHRNNSMLALHSSLGPLRFAGTAWDIVPTNALSNFWSIQADWTQEPPTLYGTTGTSVFSTIDNGATWTNDSAGLPVTPNCNDLRLVTQQDGAKYLYVSTWGRSLWRAKLDAGSTPIPTFPRIPVQVIHIIFGIIQDGGGLGSGGPVPPWNPIEVLMGGVVASVLTRNLPTNRANVRRADALEVVGLGAKELLTSKRDSLVADIEKGHISSFEDATNRKKCNFGRVLEILETCHQSAGLEQELMGGLLAAALAAKKGGKDGKAMMEEALNFVIDRLRVEEK